MTRLGSLLRGAAFITLLLIASPLAAQSTGVSSPYHEARALVAQGQSAEARALLEAWRPENPAERAQRHWALAVLLRAEGRLTEALPHLEALVALRPDVAAFRAALAAVLEALGQEERASFHYDRAQVGSDGAGPVAPPPPARPLPLWTGGFGLAITPESNPGRRTSAETISVIGLPVVIDPSSRAQPGTGLSVSAQGAWQPELTSGLNARLGIALWGEFHDSAQDEIHLTFDAGLLRRTASGESFEMALGWTRSWLDATSFSEGPVLRLGLSRPLTPRGRLTATVAAQDLRYPDLAGWEGLRSQVTLGYSHALAPNSVLRAGLRLDRTDADSPSVSHDAATLSLGGSHTFRGGLTIDLELAHRFSRHDAPVALFGTLREDRRNTITLRLLHGQVSFAGFAPVVELNLERQQSTIPLYSYENMGVSLGFTRRF